MLVFFCNTYMRYLRVEVLLHRTYSRSAAPFERGTDEGKRIKKKGLSIQRADCLNLSLLPLNAASIYSSNILDTSAPAGCTTLYI